MPRQRTPHIFCYSLAVLFVALLFAHSSGQHVEIVFPSGYADEEGPDGFPGGDIFQQGRNQIVYRADQFLNQLPESHQTITGFRWRPDNSVITGGSSAVDNLIIKLSTTVAEPGQLSTRFSDNAGPDEIIVFEGPHTVSTMNSGPLEGPREFDQEFLFQTPFKYDPNQGNLLVDMAWFSPFTSLGVDECCYQGEQYSQWIGSTGNPLSDIANVGDRSTTIVQFIFVPEPSSIILCSMGLFGLLISGGRCEYQTQSGP